MKRALVFYFLLFVFSASGQISDLITIESVPLYPPYIPAEAGWRQEYDALLADPDLSWAAKLNYRFDLDNLGKEHSPHRPPGANSDLPAVRISLIKYDVENCNLDYASHAAHPTISDDILHLAEESNERFYQDRALKNRYSTEELNALMNLNDTLVIDDTITHAPIQQITSAPLNWENIKSYQIIQLFYYRQSTHRFYTRLLAVAPVQTIADGRGKVVEMRRLFWFDPSRFAEEELYFNNPDINMLKLVEVVVPLTKFEWVKPPENPEKLNWLFKAMKGGKLKAYLPNSPDQKLKKKGKVKRAWQKQEPSENLSLQLFQYLYYDQSQRRLTLDLISLTPLGNTNLYDEKTARSSGGMLKPFFTLLAKPSEKQ